MSRIYSTLVKCISHRIFLVECFNSVSIHQKVRLYTTSAAAKSIEQKLPEKPEPDPESKKGRKYAILALEKYLNIDSYEARNIVSKHKSLYRLNGAQIQTIVAIIEKHGITKKTILKYDQMLADNELKSKLRLISRLPHDINEVVPLIDFNEHKLTRFVSKNIEAGTSSKISTLVEVLEIGVQETCELFTRKPFLNHLSANKLRANVNMLKRFGISAEDIRRDLWVLRYSQRLIEKRLKVAQEQKADSMKTWMVRAEPRIFQHYIQRQSENRLILGEHSVSEYLSSLLNCSPNMASGLIERQPALGNKNLKKLKELIEFLFAAGFTPAHICRVPKILLHSVNTIEERLKALREANVHLDSLHILTKSQRQFMQHFDIILKGTKGTK